MTFSRGTPYQYISYKFCGCDIILLVLGNGETSVDHIVCVAVIYILGVPPRQCPMILLDLLMISAMVQWRQLGCIFINHEQIFLALCVISLIGLRCLL